MQGALAYDIVQSIFVGPDNLAVEGLSDCTYLTVLSDVLGVLDRVHLDPRRRGSSRREDPDPWQPPSHRWGSNST